VQRDVAPLTEAKKLTDEAIAARVCAGEIGLFEILVLRHDQQLFRAARAILGNETEAEDALQQGWLLAYSKLGQFAGTSKLSTWLTRIVINEALALRPRLLRILEEVEMADSLKNKPSLEPSPEARAELNELARVLENAVDKLPESYRLIFVLREVQGLSTADAAECVGATEDAVKVRLHRAKAQLREVVADRVDEAAGKAWPFLGARCQRMVDQVMAAICK